MNSTLVMLLAGGVGSRLSILGYHRAKPAVPFGGMYRIIDFTLSNAMNSALNTVGVLTQYKPLSLMEHIGRGEPWDFIGRTRGARILPPRTGKENSDWYKGTADAVRQNIDFIDHHDSEHVLIVSGDHIYRMDYAELIAFHDESKADLTIGMMPVAWEETHHFGIAITDEKNRIVAWEEKPEKAKNNLASMGIYVFNTKYLLQMLQSHTEHDFGKNIIPASVESHRTFAFPYSGYWRDVGTLKAYWQANMDVLNPASGLNLADWHLRTNVEEEGRIGDRPPSYISHKARVRNSVISPGCVIEGMVENSILSPGVYVAQGANVVDSVVMHGCRILNGAQLSRCILDKNVSIYENAVLGTGNGEFANREKPEHLSSGLVVVGKKAMVPAACRIGKNTILYPGLSEEDYSSKDVNEGETIRPAYLKD